MSPDTMQEKLREHIEKIVPLTDDEFTFVLAHFTIKRFKKHQFLIQEVESVKYSFFIVLGSFAERDIIRRLENLFRLKL